ncbi:MarR family transcriptional regulator [Micromonospora sp. WMMD718]|uniref:GbsR/MarR family transcriptional regulator n=1 Tax=unclassified Micromonospora TaxID=2617518 RepID=UPI00064C38F6|nr:MULTISPECIES: MarR family transcriptional regulator [unclassified Micromonospora]MDG4752680.1 MarR family transcriptional regulator [Micromonospora sp. WMMD718]
MTTEARDAAERLALTLTKGGMQRMLARVLAALLFAESETVTAGDLCQWLQASSGTVSMSVKALSSVGLIERVPVPGSRREHFRFRDSAWAILMSSQNEVVKAMQEEAERGIEAVGADTRAGQRLREMHDFYSYLMTELPAVIDRWHASRRPTG